MRVYLDHAATTPIDNEALNEMMIYFSEYYGNASSLHKFGRDAYEALEIARERVAKVISAKNSEIIFTSGGTESDNLGIKGIAYMHRNAIKKSGYHIITSSIEHPAVLETCKYLEKEGFKVKYLPVDRDGMMNLNDLINSLSKATFLVTVMHANNEIGSIEAIEEIGKICNEQGIIFHTDAVQTFGKIPIDVKKMNIDLLSISGHKIYGPKGVGALYIKDGISIQPLIHGGGHEKYLRSGTENIPGIVGFGKAAEIAQRDIEKNKEYLEGLSGKLIKNILDNIEESYLNGHKYKRLPNNVHLRFTGIEGEALILALDEKGIAASTGSACSSKKLQHSHVLIAIGLNEVEAQESLRLTLGKENTTEEIDYVLDTLPELVQKLRKISPLWKK